MSVGLYKYDGDIYDRDSKVLLSENIASQAFYEKFWKPAVIELGIKYMQDGGEFNKSNLNDVANELSLLLDWAEKNLSDRNLEYMTTRITNLQSVIPNAFDGDDTVLYIF